MKKNRFRRLDFGDALEKRLGHQRLGVLADWKDNGRVARVLPLLGSFSSWGSATTGWSSSDGVNEQVSSSSESLHAVSESDSSSLTTALSASGFSQVSYQ